MAEREVAEVVAGLIAGLNLAVVHLARTVAVKSGIPAEELAASFEGTAAAIGSGARNADLMRMSLRQVAAGLRAAESNAEAVAAEVSGLLH